jgi:hypothetical protein
MLRPGKGDSRIYPSYTTDLKALSTFSYSNVRILEGCHFFIKTYVELSGASDVKHFMFITPTTTKIFAKVGMYASAAFTVSIYEGLTTSANGVAVTAINNNRNSSRTAELSAFSEPTVTVDGTLIWTTKIDATKQSSGVSAASNYFIFAKYDTKYLFKITKTADGDGFVDFDFFWVEQEAQ